MEAVQAFKNDNGFDVVLLIADWLAGRAFCLQPA
jgi:hypothetical protein